MPDPETTSPAGPSPEQALDKLRESEPVYRSVVAALSEGVSVYDAKGQLLASNPMASKILGLDVAQYRDRVLNDESWSTLREDGSVWAAEDYPIFVTIRTGRALTDQVMGVRRPDGTVRWLSINTQPIFEPGNPRPVQAVASFTDVTDRKQTEERLRESEDRYRSLVEHAPIGIGVHQQGRFVYANARLAAMLGASGPEALIGLSVIDTVHPDWRPAVRDRIRRITERGEVAPTLEERLIGLDGRLLDVEVAGSACLYKGMPGVQIAVLDITEKKRLERQLFQSQKMEAVGRLASGVAHEFGNLLTAITGYAALAKRTLAPSHPAVQALNRVQEAAEQAGGVTSSLLTFGRRSGGEKAPVALMEPVERAAKLLRRTLPASVELAVKSESPVWVMADANQIQQAVVNLAINARDAMRGMMRGRVEIAVGPGKCGEAQVRVVDSGQGMATEVLAQVFEPFFTTKPPGEGTGLGLAIVQRIAEDHGGRVEVASRVREGTTVTITLPRIAPPVDREAAPAAAKVGAGLGRTVLLAVAARHARELMAGALIDMGCTVAQAGDAPGLRATRAAMPGPPALFVIGADLPGLSGVACVAEMRRAGDRTPAIVICDAARECAGLDEGSVPLVEPFPMSELVAIATRLLEAPRGGEERA